jgi:hypothetical protein
MILSKYITGYIGKICFNTIQGLSVPNENFVPSNKQTY